MRSTYPHSGLSVQTNCCNLRPLKVALCNRRSPGGRHEPEDIQARTPLGLFASLICLRRPDSPSTGLCQRCVLLSGLQKLCGFALAFHANGLPSVTCTIADVLGQHFAINQAHAAPCTCEAKIFLHRCGQPCRPAWRCCNAMPQSSIICWPAFIE